MKTISIPLKAFAWSFDGHEQTCTALLPGEKVATKDNHWFDFEITDLKYKDREPDDPYFGELMYGEDELFDIEIQIPVLIVVL